MFEFGPSTVEPPDDLVRRLTQLKLCRPADFRRARAAVRRLSRDLPAFDSVWIDALAQLRILTPFQARELESGQPDSLLIGPHVVVDELGEGPHGRTLLARNSGRRELIVLKRLDLPIEAIPDSRNRLTDLIERSRDWSHPNIVVPQELLVVDGQPIVTISRWIPGLTLSELLIRRGRFPAEITLEIARQLAAGLASLQARALVHGDLRLSNIRLNSSGTVVAVDGGIRPAICPELTIHETLALDAYDGVAPELIGTGLGPNAGSEIYALGCLLWQLLTGRPPYSMADPLMKLAAHQSSRIADVRTLAPDTPASLAESIFAMTSPDVNERPRSFDDLLQRWGRPGMTSRSRLKQYRKNVDGGVPHFIQMGSAAPNNRWVMTAVLLFVVSGMALSFADRGMRTHLLTISQRMADSLRRSPTVADNPNPSVTSNTGQTELTTVRPTTSDGLLALPVPNSQGEILLSEPGPYDVVKIANTGRLTIRGEPGVNPAIKIGKEPLRLAGTSVTLENLTVVCEDAGQSLPAMLLVKSQELSIRGCAFERKQSGSASVGHNFAVAGWQPWSTDNDSPAKSSIQIENSSFRVHGSAVWLAEVPRNVSISNCLKLNDGPCLAISPKAIPRRCQLNLAFVTLRDAGSLLKLSGRLAEQKDAPPIEIAGHDSVFALSPACPGLIELVTNRPRSDLSRSVQMTGQGLIVPPGARIMSVTGTNEKGSVTVKTVDEADELFEGILVSDLQFAGPISGPPADSELASLTAPRKATDANPGIDPKTIPATGRLP
ncbi:MAG: serine/threonine-protein kinase [Planctomycetaceae bacterium]